MRTLLSRVTSTLLSRKSFVPSKPQSAYRQHLRLESLESRQVMSASNLFAIPSIPVLNSNPSAPADLYLDFDGHKENLRFGGIGDNIKATDTRGSFSMDANRSSFSEAEVTAIQTVWEHVAEDFSPFNVNVTTIEPESSRFSNGQAVRVVIGGADEFWFNPTNDPETGAAGVHYPKFRHIAFVFSDEHVHALGSQQELLAAAIGNTVSHEAGHAYGLDHQEFYDRDGTQPKKTSDLNPEYNPGQRQGPGSEILDDWAPIMGGGADDKRTTWHNGATSASNRDQDDMAVLGRVLGYRADDHGGSVATATWLPISGNEIQSSGVIGSTGDADYFAFWHGGGRVLLKVDVTARGANLDAKLELRNHQGTLLQSFDSDLILGAAISADLPKGTYHVVVKSHGDYGDVGQYNLTGVGISSVGYSTTGPRVIFSAPENPAVAPFFRGPVTMLVTFDKPINRATLSTSDVTFVSPTGRRIAAYSIELLPGAHGGRTFRIQAHLPELGTYRIEIGPFVNDLFGNNMDQDRDGVKGELTADRYSTIAVTRRMPTLGNIAGNLARSY